MPGVDAGELFSRGERLMRDGRADEAAIVFSESARHTPDNDPSLGMRLQAAAQSGITSGLQRDAAEHLKRLTKLRPNDTQAKVMLAQTLRFSGDLQGSLGVIESLPQALRDKPGAVALHADVLDALGKTEEAIKILEPHVKGRVRNVALATTFARLAPERAGEAEAYIRELLAVPGLKDRGRATLLFRLGALLERAEDYTGAMEAYTQANNALGGPDTTKADDARTNEIIRIFAKDFFATAPVAAEAGRALLVVGMPRSGTTLIERTIAAHPDAAGAGELPTLTQIALSMPASLGSKPGYPACITGLTQEACDTAADRYNKTLSAVDGAALRVVDKMPHNFMHLGLASRILPGAPVVHLRRSAMDTCLSCFTSGLGPNHTYARSFDRLAAAYAQYQRLLEHWRSVLPEPMIEVRYEDLASDHEQTSRKLLETVGLGWDDACARPQDAASPVSTLSVDQVRRPVGTGSVGRAERFGELIKPLREALQSRGIDPAG